MPQGFSGEKKQRKGGIYEKSVKKEGCEFARNAVLSKNVLPLYIFDSRFMQVKRKYRQKCTSMYTFDSEFWQNQNIAGKTIHGCIVLTNALRRGC